jgi:hypothetical protein
MSNDDWRFTSPTPPHAPPHDPWLAGMRAPPEHQPPPLVDPGPPAPPSNFGSYENYGYDGGYAGAGVGSGVSPFVWFFFFLFFPVTFPIFACLYPLAAGAAALVGRAVYVMAGPVGPTTDVSSRLPFVLASAAIVLWTVSRLEHRLARFAPYRAVRHVVRLLLFGFYAVLLVFHSPSSGYFPSSLPEIVGMIANPPALVVMVIVAFIMHRVLTRRQGLRESWHAALRVLRLRPA